MSSRQPGHRARAHGARGLPRPRDGRRTTPCVARIRGCTPGLRANEAATIGSDGDFPDVSLYVTYTGTGGAVLAETLEARGRRGDHRLQLRQRQRRRHPGRRRRELERRPLRAHPGHRAGASDRGERAHLERRCAVRPHDEPDRGQLRRRLQRTGADHLLRGHLQPTNALQVVGHFAATARTSRSTTRSILRISTCLTRASSRRT